MKRLATFTSFNTVAAGLAAFLINAASLSHAADQSRSDVIKESKPQFVFVGGEVKIPQRYIYTNGMTASAAVQMAKGVTDQASPKLTLTREGQKPITLDLEAIGKNKDKDLELKAGDKVFVPRR
jgi:protein involved in polysaccharide export with SLBB domain